LQNLLALHRDVPGCLEAKPSPATAAGHPPVVLASPQVRAIVRSRFPAIRAAQSLAATTAFFLLLYASTYLAMSVDDAGSFSEPLTRSDSLYFTVTVFSTYSSGTALSDAGAFFGNVRVAIWPRHYQIRSFTSLDTDVPACIVRIGSSATGPPSPRSFPPSSRS
jgi:hypothetical protein